MKTSILSKSLMWVCIICLGPTRLYPQAIQSHSARQDPGEQVLQLAPERPKPSMETLPLGQVVLLPGLFRERRELTKAYVLSLKTENVLQNHLLEAGVRIDRPYEQLHQGWEAPHGQLRGHFAGHWLASVSRFAALDQDPLVSSRARLAIQELKRCQTLNHGQWVGSIPEKYFAQMAEGQPIWSPQYTVHKTLMGLLEAYRDTGDEEALLVLKQAADWFVTWTDALIQQGRGASIYSGECAGMLELWTDLYAVTKDERHLRLAARYAMPDLFRTLLDGGDPLSNDHANASIPWIHGAARLYEVIGDNRYREIVERFWGQAVDNRGMFATTGNNAGEFWVPPKQFGRFLGSRTQEHCTVYNMLRVAQYLLRWTGDARFADYIERALYNGILAQQNPQTGMVAYFLPLQPGSRKIWGSETQDFWCCHGTLVQAQTLFEDLIYYRSGGAITVMQYLPSTVSLELAGGRVRLSQRMNDEATKADFSKVGKASSFSFTLKVESEKTEPWTLRIRRPAWAGQEPSVLVDGIPVKVEGSATGYLEIKRSWRESTVVVSFPKEIRREALPGDPSRFALLDGPVVLAALSASEPDLSAKAEFSPRYEHQYVEGRDWQTSHYAVRSAQGSVELKPLHEIKDEVYSVYFHSAD